MTKQQVLTGQAILQRIDALEREQQHMKADAEVAKALGETNSYVAENLERTASQLSKLNTALAAL